MDNCAIQELYVLKGGKNLTANGPYFNHQEEERINDLLESFFSSEEGKKILKRQKGWGKKNDKIGIYE
jgi:hypothetical protein